VLLEATSVLANFLIGLREGLEASLVVSILVAYLVKSGRRDLLPALWSGIGVAVLISLGAGAALTYGPRGLTFEAQEAIGGTLSIVAVGLITWMVFWMGRTARHLKADLQHRLGSAMVAGRWAVVVMAVLAVGREGLETALFLWAGAQATGATAQPLLGAVLGIAVSVGLAWAVYRGALRLNLRLFFAWTGSFLIVVAAGVLSYGVHDLQEAGILPGLGDLAFDVSAQIAPSSWYGAVLKGVFNFSPATTWLELAAWWLYLLPTLFVFVRTVRPGPSAGSSGEPVPAPVTSTAPLGGDR
jgi:high-affinity iron transporter